jgi:hypothetical protein
VEDEKSLGRNQMFKFGVAFGFAAGYYYGAKAGRARYEQLNQLLHKVQESEAAGVATNKAKAVMDLTAERAREMVSHN